MGRRGGEGARSRRGVFHTRLRVAARASRAHTEITMSDERDDEKAKEAKEAEEKDEPVKQLAEGIGMLLKAAKGAAKGIKKELDKTNVGKVFEDAGREFARAATNVVEQVSAEISGKKRPGSHAPPPPHEHEEAESAAAHHDEADEFDGVKPKSQAGSTPEDHGVRIVVDEDDKKPR